MRRHRRSAAILAAIATASLILAPALAEARVGGRSSMGSRGARTYSAPPPTQTAPGTVRPMDRTMTEPSRPGAPTAPYRSGASARSPFMTGLMGGLLGAGLFGLLSGAGLFGGLGSFAGLLGFLLQIALIAGLVWLVVRLLRGARRPEHALAGGPGAPRPTRMARGMHGMMGGAAAGPRAGAASAPVALDRSDFDTFERLLQEVQAAWTQRDLTKLRQVATPEMVGFFEDDYAALDTRGWRNEVRDVRLEQGDLSEAWREDGREYATVAMRFSLVDVTRRVADGAVMEGDPNQRTEATELWTFVRPVGGRWVLSAIQQTG